MTAYRESLVKGSTLRYAQGIIEDALHPFSGLRSFRQHLIINSQAAPAVNIAVAHPSNIIMWGGITGAGVRNLVSTTTFTELALGSNTVYAGTGAGHKRMPFPCTPVILVRNQNGVPANIPASVFTFRVSGYDQFGQTIQEEIGPITRTAGATGVLTWIWCQKVFSWITKFEYKASALDGEAGANLDRIDMGYRFIWPTSLAAGASEQWHLKGGQGIGIPIRLQRFEKADTLAGYSEVSAPVLYPEFLGGLIHNLADGLQYMPVPYEGALSANWPYVGGTLYFGVDDASATRPGTPHKWMFNFADATASTIYALNTGAQAVSATHLLPNHSIIFDMEWRTQRGYGRAHANRSYAS